MEGVKRNTLVYALTLCCLLCLILLHCSEAKKHNNNNNKKAGRAGKQGRGGVCKNKRTFSLKASDLLGSPKVLKCPKGPVVATQVLGIKGKCRGTTGFTRWTEGRCMWNQTCELTFKDQVIDSLAPNVKDKSCLGQVPNKLEVGYTCLKKKAVVTDTLGSFQKSKRAWGVVRSHKLFPWSYRNGQQLGNLTFLRPRKPAGLTHLWISVHFYAILNSDLVFLSWEEDPPAGSGQRIRAMRQILPNDTTFALPDVPPPVILTFYADYSSHPSGIGGEEKGFLLCYQWLKAKAKPKKGSACSKVMMPGKCKSKGGRGRKGGNSKSRNNNKNNNRKSRNQQKSRNSQGARSNARSRNSRPNRNRQQ